MKMTAEIISDDIANVVRVQVEDTKGQVTNTVVSFEDYVECLTASSLDLDEMVLLGRLPWGYYNGAVHRNRMDTFRVVIIVPAERRMFNYIDEVYENIPYPSLAFEFRAVKGNITHSKCYALADEYPTDDSILYHYPFGNVYDDARICWGSNHLKRVASMKDVDQFIPLFFGSQTNNDLFGRGSFSLDAPEYVSSQRALLETLKDMEKFPVDILAKAGPRLGNLLQ